MKRFKEKWVAVEGYEDAYEISNLGRVKSYKNGKHGLRNNPKLLKAQYTGCYYVVRLYDEGKRDIRFIHKLILDAFIPNPENKPEGNHKDGNKLNNNIDNLEWVTRGENQQHAYDTGLMLGPIGEKSSLAKLSRFQVQRMRLAKKINPKLTYAKLGEMFGTSWRNAWNIIHYKTWKHA